MHGRDQRIYDALRAAGIIHEGDYVRRVIIDIDVDQAPVIHIERIRRRAAARRDPHPGRHRDPRSRATRLRARRAHERRDDGRDDLGRNPEQAARTSGKDIADPAGGAAETRGGESPADWQGPLPDRRPRHRARQQAAGPPTGAATLSCGGD